MDFIRNLHEARMTRNSANQRSLTYTDCCERAFLSLMILDVMRRFPKFVPFVQAYAKKTSGYELYDKFRIDGTDLYNFIHFMVGDEDALGKLKDPGSASRLRKQTHIPLMQLNGFLIQLRNNQSVQSNTLLIKFDNSIPVNNAVYSELRRAIVNFNSISTRDRGIVVTKLLYAARAKLRNSDIIEKFEELAQEKDLELSKVSDTEPKISTPDIATTTKDISNYRFLVGSDKMMLAQKFVDTASKNKSVPSGFVQGYKPVIAMIHDIVKAGPAYIQQLKLVHNRAKKELKK